MKHARRQMISVAMCTYNGARYLQEQLESIAAQTRPPDELVICDDCSTDNTREILEAFKAQAAFPVRLYYNERNLQSSKNFEKAISLCEGDVIATCDQDDVWLPEKLRRAEKVFAARPDVGLVFSDLECVDEELRPLGFRAWQCYWTHFTEREQRLFSQGRELSVLLTRNVVTGTAMAFRAKYKDLILPIPEFSRHLIHDWWIAMLIAADARLAYIKTPLIKYRFHSGQVTGLIKPEPDEPDPRGPNRWVELHSVEFLLGIISEKNDPRFAAAVANLQAIIRHRQSRTELVKQKFTRRALLVLRELLTGRYRKSATLYSDGWRDAVDDVMPYRFKHHKSPAVN